MAAVGRRAAKRNKAARASRYGDREHKPGFKVPRRYGCGDPRCPEDGPHWHEVEEEASSDD